MVLWVKALTIKPDNLTPALGLMMVGGKNQLLQIVF